MTKYKVEFSYNVPEWGDVELDAESEDEATSDAERHILMSFPEAIDVSIDKVEELSANG